jgi:hypothetical protein
MTKRVLYLLGCAAPPVQYIDRAIRDAQAQGWDVCLGLTQTAAGWLADRRTGGQADRRTGGQADGAGGADRISRTQCLPDAG